VLISLDPTWDARVIILIVMARGRRGGWLNVGIVIIVGTIVQSCRGRFRERSK